MSAAYIFQAACHSNSLAVTADIADPAEVVSSAGRSTLLDRLWLVDMLPAFAPIQMRLVRIPRLRPRLRS